MANKTNKISVDRSLDNSPVKDIFIYVLYLLVILLPQYFKGGYFESTFLPYIISASLLMIYYVFKHYKDSEVPLIKREADLLLLLLTLIYGLTCFYGVTKRGSIIEFIKYGSFLSIFLITSDIHGTNKARKRTMDFIILSGVVLCIIGIGTMIGTWEYPASYVGNRLSSTFQYPNTLAVYAASMYFMTMGQALMEEDSKRIGVYGGALFVFFSTLIFTYSRGMWLIFPIILLGFFAVLPGVKKVELFFYTLGSLLVALPLSFLFLKYVGEEGANLWTLYLAGTLVSALVLLVLGLATKFLSKISWKIVIAFVLIIGVSMAGVLFVAINQTEPIYYENTSAEEVTTRLVRHVRNVFPNIEYEINVNGEAKINEEGKYAGRLVVYSVDENSKYTHLGTFDVLENGTFDLSATITTPEDINTLTIYFENRNIDTSIVYNEANIKDIEAGTLVNIPLKYKYIPEAIVSRISGISTSDSSASARIIFSKDAMKLVLNSFLLGTGGQGWETSYRSIQSYPYWSKHVHNHYLQLFVETGLLGMVLFGGILLVLLFGYIKYKKREEDINNRALADTLFISAGTILAHAAIDFDLSLTGLYLILWVILGLLSATVAEEKKSLSLLSKSISYQGLRKLNNGVVATTIVSLVLSTTIYAGYSFSQKAIKAQDNGDTDGIESSMRKASIFDPFNTKYISELMEIYFFQYGAKSDESYGDKAKGELDKLIKYGKHDPTSKVVVGQGLFKFGLVDEGLEFMRESLSMQPLMIDSYGQNTSTHISIFEYYMDMEDYDMAEATALEGYNFLNEILLLSNERTVKPMAKNNRIFWELSRLNYLGQNFDDYLSNLRGRNQIRYFYDYSLDVDNDGYVELVSSWNAENGKLQYEKGDGYIRFTNPGENYGVFDTLSMDLEPDTTYLIRFDVRGNMAPDKVNFYMMDTKAKDQIQSESIYIDQTEDWQTYEMVFTTHEDVGDETARLRFIIRGDNEGYMDIKDFKLFE